MSPTPPARADLAARTRVDNTAWCLCTKCAALQTERECCCCRELAHIRHLFSDVECLQCITDHPEFVGAWLNPLTLRIALVLRCDGDKRESYTSSYSQKVTGDCVTRTALVTVLLMQRTYRPTHAHAMYT